MSETSDQPVVDDATSAVPAGVAVEAPASTDDIDTEAFDRVEAPDEDADDATGEDGEPLDPDKQTPAAQAEEIEFEADDGTKLKIPKALETALLRQADYTRKTQEVAELRRGVDADKEALAAAATQQAESLKTYRTEHLAIGQAEAQLSAIETELSDYRKLTPDQWAAEQSANPANYDANIKRLEFLRNMRATVSENIEAAKTELAAKEEGLTKSQQAAQKDALAKAWQETSATLAKDIPEWSPTKGQAIATFAVKEFGFTPAELQEATDPRAWKMAHEVMTLRAENARLKTTQKQTTATTAALKTQVVTPAVKPAGNAPSSTGVRDDLSTDEWLRRRNAQIAKRAKG